MLSVNKPIVTLGSGFNTIENKPAAPAIFLESSSAEPNKDGKDEKTNAKKGENIQINIQIPQPSPPNPSEAANKKDGKADEKKPAEDKNKEQNAPQESVSKTDSKDKKNGAPPQATYIELLDREITGHTRLFSSLTELQREFDSSLSVSLPDTNTTIKLNLSGIHKQSAQEIYYTLELRCREKVHMLPAPYKLHSSAQNFLSALKDGKDDQGKSLRAFFNKYGDSYIDSIMYGRWAFVIIQIKSLSTEDQRKLSGELEQTLGSNKIGGSFSNTLQKKLKDEYYTIHLYTGGMDYSAPKLLTSISALEELIQKFSVQDQKTETTQIGWTYKPYEMVVDDPLPEEEETNKDSLEKLENLAKNDNLPKEKLEKINQQITELKLLLKNKSLIRKAKENAIKLNQVTTAARELSYVIERARKAARIYLHALNYDKRDTNVVQHDNKHIIMLADRSKAYKQAEEAYENIEKELDAEKKKVKTPEVEKQIKALEKKLKAEEDKKENFKKDTLHGYEEFVTLKSIEGALEKIAYLIKKDTCDLSTIQTVTKKANVEIEKLRNIVKDIPPNISLLVKNISGEYIQPITHSKREYNFKLNLPDDSEYLKLQIVGTDMKPEELGPIRLKQLDIEGRKKYLGLGKIKNSQLGEIEQGNLESNNIPITTKLSGIYLKSGTRWYSFFSSHCCYPPYGAPSARTNYSVNIYINFRFNRPPEDVIPKVDEVDRAVDALTEQLAAFIPDEKHPKEKLFSEERAPWATGEKIKKVLHNRLGETVHLVDPDWFSNRSLFSSNPAEVEEVVRNIAEYINGYETIINGKKERIKGIIQQDGGELKKPIVMILNTSAVKAKDSKDVNAVGGSHWVTLVILPKKYKIKDNIIQSDKEQIFLIDSLGITTQLPRKLCNIIINGGTFRFDSTANFLMAAPFNSKTEFMHVVPPIFPQAKFVELNNFKPQQTNNDDCGWWAVDNAIKIVEDGSAENLIQKDFPEAIKKLRGEYDLAESNKAMPPVAPALKKNDKKDEKDNKKNDIKDDIKDEKGPTPSPG